MGVFGAEQPPASPGASWDRWGRPFDFPEFPGLTMADFRGEGITLDLTRFKDRGRQTSSAPYSRGIDSRVVDSGCSDGIGFSLTGRMGLGILEVGPEIDAHSGGGALPGYTSHRTSKTS